MNTRYYIRNMQMFVSELTLVIMLGCISVSHMWHVLTDGVALSVTVMSPTKTAEPIEMLFGFWTRVDQRNHAY